MPLPFLCCQADDELEASSVRSITHILSSLSTATPLPSASSTALNKTGLPPTALSPVSAETPSHLRDLQAEDLPEDKRAGVLSQIGSFRSAQNERERERKKAEEEKERRRIEQVIREGRSHPSASPGGGGPSSHVNPYQQGGHSPAVNKWQQRQDPQSYNHPVAFVPAGGRSAREKTDEELEEGRRERKRREADDQRVQRERRLDNIERQRTQRLEREAQAERTRQAEERRAFESARDKESRWDSDDEAEHGSRELWISDRCVYFSHPDAKRSLSLKRVGSIQPGLDGDLSGLSSVVERRRPTRRTPGRKPSRSSRPSETRPTGWLGKRARWRSSPSSKKRPVS